MSATYNWAYRPGITNKYNLNVPAGADDATLNGWKYVALYGNDVTGNGSRLYPYRTIKKAASENFYGRIIVGSGIYRESEVGFLNYTTLIGDGDVIIDVSYNNFLSSQPADVVNCYNITFRGNGVTSYVLSMYTDTIKIYDCYFDACGLGPMFGYFTSCYNSTFANFSGRISFDGNRDDGNFITNNTFVNCSNINVADTGTNWSSNIFYRCNIAIADQRSAKIRYTLFHHCNIKLGGTGNGGVLYPGTPDSYTYYNTLEELQNAFLGLYGAKGFQACKFADPLFNNLNIGDFTLAFNSPAKNLSYYGTYVGSRSIAQGLKIRANEAEGDFDLSSAVNIVVTDDNLQLVNSGLNGVIETKVIENIMGRELKGVPAFGFVADRNGQYIDSIKDLADSVIAAGGELAIPASYLVETAAIVYNGQNLKVGDRFTTAPGHLTFTTVSGGTAREIKEAPQRHTVEIKFSDVQPFTTETYQHYELALKPTSNNVGDSRAGAILRGNGDPGYVRGGLGVTEFPINAKYIKIRFTIQANNLKG